MDGGKSLSPADLTDFYLVDFKTVQGKVPEALLVL